MDNLSPKTPPAVSPPSAPPVPMLVLTETTPSAEPPSPSPSPASPRAGASEGRKAFGLVLLCLLFWQVTLCIPIGNAAIVWTTTLLYLLLTLLFTVRTARALRSPSMQRVSLLLSAVLALPAVLVPILHFSFPQWGGWHALSPPLMAYFLLLRAIPGLKGLLLIWFAASLGVSLSRLVREFKLLLPMAVALALVDLYVVFGGGLVAQAQQGGNPVPEIAMKTMLVNLPRPTAHPPGGAAPMQLAVGFADFMFLALFFACFARFGIPSRTTFLVVSGVLAAYMVVVGMTGWAMPALVPIAVVVIGMNLRRFRYERSEAFALLYAGVIVAAVAGGYFFVNRTPIK